MTISYCLATHGQRIAMLPIGQWKEAIQSLPEQCEHEDCSTRNCREVCRVWLRGQFMIKRALARQADTERKQTMRGGR